MSTNNEMTDISLSDKHKDISIQSYVGIVFNSLDNPNNINVHNWMQIVTKTMEIVDKN